MLQTCGSRKIVVAKSVISDHRRCTFQSVRYSFEFMSDYDPFVEFEVSGDEQFQVFLLLSVFVFYYFYFILLVAFTGNLRDTNAE